jgi:Tol biopolymer transport system component
MTQAGGKWVVPFDAFISYSNHDKLTADAACAALEGANIRCWIAPRDVNAGRDYGEALIDAIESAKVFVLIFSSNANSSSQIKREVERAVSKGLPIIPVRIEDVLPSRTLEYFISSPHWLDAFPPPPDRYFAKLIESVRALLDTEKGTTPQKTAAARSSAAEKKQTGRRLPGLIIAGVVAAFAAVAAGGYALYLKNQDLVHTLTGHGADADSVAFSPDGNLIAAGGWDATICIWSTADGRLREPAISGFYGNAAPFSPDGKWIAAGSDSDVKIWDAVTRRAARTFSGHSAQVRTVAFSPDGKSLVSGGNDRMVFIWDLAGNQPGRQLAGHNDQVVSVAFSSDGKRVASASFDQSVIVWDVASAQPVKTLVGTNKMMAAIFSADDAWLATAGWDGNVTVWDTSRWQVVRLLPGNGQMVTSIAFSPTGRLIASAGYDSAVKVWDTATSRLVRTYSGHSDIVWAVGFSPNGKWIASASKDKTVKIWKAPQID